MKVLAVSGLFFSNAVSTLHYNCSLKGITMGLNICIAITITF